jgi:hypothetical protein
MTPREFDLYHRGRAEADERELQRVALLACWVMNPWLKKPMTPNQLLRGKPAQQRLTGDALWASLAEGAMPEKAQT